MFRPKIHLARRRNIKRQLRVCSNSEAFTWRSQVDFNHSCSLGSLLRKNCQTRITKCTTQLLALANWTNMASPVQLQPGDLNQQLQVTVTPKIIRCAQWGGLVSQLTPHSRRHRQGTGWWGRSLSPSVSTAKLRSMFRLKSSQSTRGSHLQPPILRVRPQEGQAKWSLKR
jgi:hypothetical protein